MEILMQLIIFLISITILLKSSYQVIKSSVKIAAITKLSQMVIGFILLSVATSVPEIAISFSSLTSQDSSLAIGNILGSNIANICLILGLALLIKPITITEKSFQNLSGMVFISSLILLLLLNVSVASSFVGILLICIFGIFCIYSVKRKITIGKIELRSLSILQKLFITFEFYKQSIILAISLFVVLISSRFVVESSLNIATMLGIKESVIGASIIAVGTSLPELFTTLTAIKEAHISLALGNTVGSCLTNLTLVLGIVLLSPFVVDFTIFSTLITFVLIINILSWFFFSRKFLEKKHGIIFLAVYFIFLLSLFGVQISIL